MYQKTIRHSLFCLFLKSSKAFSEFLKINTFIFVLFCNLLGFLIVIVKMKTKARKAKKSIETRKFLMKRDSTKVDSIMHSYCSFASLILSKKLFEHHALPINNDKTLSCV